MIVKNHEIPLKLLKASAAHQRLFQNHREFRRIENDLYRERSGYVGELRVDYPLSRLNFTPFILHDLRLRLFQNHFQMDTTLITDRFILIIEVKNSAGILSFNSSFNQMIQTLNGQVKNYDDPLIQVEEQKHQLRQRIDFFNGPNLPIETVVVMANPKAILDISANDQPHLQRVIPISLLTNKVREISDQFSQRIISQQETSELAHYFKDHHEYAGFKMEDHYNIDVGDFRKGVFCPYCGALGMNRTKRRWECRRCHGRNKDAHLNAFKDHFLLISPEITNRGLRDFLQISSPSTSKILLNQSSFEKIGKTNTRKYLMNFDYQSDFGYLLK
ncbi:NERD domain-containing protein [Alkalibacillus aidingensis]|uniref:NERD domain-containing protein n=1 Tax=Alkalibacillus aidingensis TaxID=2747607 RepID=UPI001660A260|nr:NERD domain-containing protein [Alkalibacillus aidingensis]